jgi:hypothetical protein
MFQPADSAESASPAAPTGVSAPSAPSFEPFLLVPQTRKFFMGQARHLPIQELWVIVFFGFFTFMAMCLLVGALGEYADAGRLQQSGVITQGTIISRTLSSGKSTSYYLTYEFSVKGSDTRFTRQQTVRRAAYEAHPEGSLVTVAYLPDDPNVSRLAGKDADDSVMQASVPESGLFVLITLVIMFFLLRPVVRDRWLARNGRILEGKVVKSNGRLAGSKRRYYRLTVQYEFLSPSGVLLSGKQNAQRDDLRHSLLPRPGAPVAVLYADDRHYKML